MTPELVENWDIDEAGTRVRLTLKKGIKFNSPRGFENIDFGEANADELVELLNRTNLATNPDSTSREGGDLAAVFKEARKIDEYTVEIGLVAPIYFCLPLSQFGCLGTETGFRKVTHAESMGEEWAKSHAVGTGPFVHGKCIANDQCTIYAVPDHWRQTASVSSITGIQVPEASTQLAMLRNGTIDMTDIDFKLLPDVLAEGFRFIETMPGGLIGQSILFSGNLWEHTQLRTGEPLEPWNGPTYEIDYPWIGNPWGDQGAPCSDNDAPGHELCGNAPYTDVDNPDDMSDMEQARLVRLALSTSIARDEINDFALFGMGTPLYSEYMGPEYPGWDPQRSTGCFDWLGGKTECKGTVQSVPWKLPDSDLAIAGELLTAAGYPLIDGKRTGFEKLTLQSYPAEAGPVSIEIADLIMADWALLGIEIEGLVESYGSVISPRMRNRTQFLPIIKNGDVHSNVFPLDFPLPPTDTSSTRPGWGVGFESQAGARWLIEILGEKDPSVRTEKHLNWVDYSEFWVQYAGVFQIPKGIVVNDRIKSWDGRQQHYRTTSSNPEFIVLN